MRAPKIHRVLQCPAGRSFATLHRALQAAFGWTNSHSYSFSACDTSIGNRTRTRRYKLFVSLLDPEMQPESYYMSEFDDDQPIHDRCYPTLKASQLRYGDLFGHEGLRDAEWSYRYDYGDNWEHEIEVLGGASLGLRGLVVRRLWGMVPARTAAGLGGGSL
jgi:hypothetical protein